MQMIILFIILQNHRHFKFCVITSRWCVCIGRRGSWMEWVLSPNEMTDQGNNNQNISCNPFAALFSSLADAKQFASGQKPQQSAEAPCEFLELLHPFIWNLSMIYHSGSQSIKMQCINYNSIQCKKNILCSFFGKKVMLTSSTVLSTLFWTNSVFLLSGGLWREPVWVRKLCVRQRRWKWRLCGRDQPLVPVPSGALWTAQCQSHDPENFSHHSGQQ